MIRMQGIMETMSLICHAKMRLERNQRTRKVSIRGNLIQVWKRNDIEEKMYRLLVLRSLYF